MYDWDQGTREAVCAPEKPPYSSKTRRDKTWIRTMHVSAYHWVSTGWFTFDHEFTRIHSHWMWVDPLVYSLFFICLEITVPQVSALSLYLFVYIYLFVHEFFKKLSGDFPLAIGFPVRW